MNAMLNFSDKIIPPPTKQAYIRKLKLQPHPENILNAVGNLEKKSTKEIENLGEKRLNTHIDGVRDHNVSK